MSATVAPQPQAVAGIGPRRIRLRAVEIARHNQIEIPVAVDVGRDDAPDRRDLREVRQRGRRERPVAVVLEIDTRKRVSLIMQRSL